MNSGREGTHGLNVLVVYESMFGNTRQVAEAVAAGLSEHAHVDTIDVARAPTRMPADIDLLVLGGPTHAFSMSRESTREDAIRRGADNTDLKVGIRDWLAALSLDGSDPAFAAFDTRVNIPLLPGSAAKAATSVAKGMGFHTIGPESFRVEGYEGPLIDGELARATDWGRHLGEQTLPRPAA